MANYTGYDSVGEFHYAGCPDEIPCDICGEGIGDYIYEYDGRWWCKDCLEEEIIHKWKKEGSYDEVDELRDPLDDPDVRIIDYFDACETLRNYWS